MAGAAKVLLACLGTIAAATCIVIGNKKLMNDYGFRYIFALTGAHMAVGAVALRLFASMGVFQRKSYPLIPKLGIAVLGICAICGMNLSLQWNSVGTYQLMKLGSAPLSVALYASVYGRKFDLAEIASLALVILGIYIVTRGEISVNSSGIIIGICAVFFVVGDQVYAGEQMRKYELQSMQANIDVMAIRAILLFLLSFFLETGGDEPIQEHEFSFNEMLLIFLTCVFALVTNTCSLIIISSTSAVTFQVVGHCKTILILLAGWVLFPVTDETFFRQAIGVLFALPGIIAYGYFTHVRQEAKKNKD